MPPRDISNEKTVIAPLKKADAARDAVTVVPTSGKQAAPAKSKDGNPAPIGADKAGSSVPKRSSALPIIVFGVIAMLFWGMTAALVTVHVMTGGDSEFTTAELNADLVPVEPDQSGAAQDTVDQAQPPDVIMAPPDLITALSGDPIVIRRPESGSRQIVKLGIDAAMPARTIGVLGNVYRLNDALATTGSDVTASIPGSQQSFAFFQAASAEGTGDAIGAAAPDPASGATDEQQTDSLDGNTSILTVNADVGASSRKELAKRLDQDGSVSQALVQLGFDQQNAKQVETALADQFQIESLSKGDAILVRGGVESSESRLFVNQISIHRGGRYAATVALSDKGSYEKGVDPWLDQDVLSTIPQQEGTGARLRLLDAIYTTAVRNGLPTSIAGETILLLSRAYDLDQTVGDNEKITILYNDAARDSKTGFGRVLYVRIDRAKETIECYAFQPAPGKFFSCVSGDGMGSTFDGMVTPVKGVLTAKFGPKENPTTHKTEMNFGVDWAAPLGTAVVAAFDGQVSFAGQKSGYGNFIKLDHSDGRATGYAYLQRFATGIDLGAKVRAGETIGYVGRSEDTQEPVLHFELYRGGQPVDPFGDYQRAVEKGTAVGGAIDVFVGRIITIESANRCDAANPLSTAVGLGQFIESTWLTMIAAHRPDLMQGRTRRQILDLRTQCDLARDMTAALVRDNAAYIRSRGHSVTAGSLYLAHFLGPGGAATALGSPLGAQVADTLGANVVRANPFLSGKNIAWLIDWAARKMNQKESVQIAQAPNSPEPSKPQIKYADNKIFLAMKAVVDTLLR